MTCNTLQQHTAILSEQVEGAGSQLPSVYVYSCSYKVHKAFADYYKSEKHGGCLLIKPVKFI